MTASTHRRLAEVRVSSIVLPSGIRIVFAQVPPDPAQTPRVYVGAYEPYGIMNEEQPGKAHLIEHIVANNRPDPAGPPLPPNDKIFERNAVTRQSYTSYFMTVAGDVIEPMIYNRLARLGQTGADPKIFKRESGRVIDELHSEARGQFPAFKALRYLGRSFPTDVEVEVAYARDTPDAVLQNQIRRIYGTDKGILVVAGNIPDVERAKHYALDAASMLQLDRRQRVAAIPPYQVKLRTGASLVLQNRNTGEEFLVGAGWPEPAIASPDRLPFLVLDQLLLGGRQRPDDVARSDASPVGRELAASIYAHRLWDGRNNNWGAPPYADAGIYPIIFNTTAEVHPEQVRRAVRKALLHVQRTVTDRQINEAKQHLADFYEQWILEPSYRNLGDHLAGEVFARAKPSAITSLPNRIRDVRPSEVRRVFATYLSKDPLVVVLPPNKAMAAK